MNERLFELAKRHGSLQARIAEQRRALAQHAEPVAAALEKGDAVLRGVDWLKAHPGVVAGGVAAVAIARPRRAWRLAKRGFFVWRGWQSLKAALGNVL